MRKGFKKLLVFATAATLAIGAMSLTACDGKFTPPAGIPDGEVSSNGGFVVSKGDWYYFINGKETYTANNTYGKPVKGALMRIKKADLAEKNNAAETVVPSLMVAGDYTSGLYIYGDRVYYATPTSDKSTTGVVENSYLDFNSAKLDGTDVKMHFRLSSNATVYRYVQTEGTVYVLYAEGSSSYTLHSYNTATETDTTLVKNATGYVLNSGDKTDPYVYYTLGVTDKADSDGAINLPYNQIYRVRADATAAPYEYQWDQDYLDENANGELPYWNYGEIVLDGMGANENPTQFNHSDSTPTSPVGYTYSLLSYNNGGVYFTRTQTSTASGTTGADGALYFLDGADLGTGWDSISANDVAKNAKLDVVAGALDAQNKATQAAYFYRDAQGGHHYLYVANSNLYRADVDENGALKEDLAVAYDIGSSTIVGIDTTSDATYSYAYLTRSSGSGYSIERAVFNGDENDYRNLVYTGEGGAENNKAYAPVRVLESEHAGDWYNYEVLDGYVFFADAMAFSSTSYNYVSAIDLKKANGALKNNVEIEEWNDRYDALFDSDVAKGFIAKLTNDRGNSRLSNAVRYYFFTGETAQFDENIDFAVENGQKETALYSEEEKAAFHAFAEGKGYTGTDGKEIFKETDFKDGETSYRTYSYFVTRLGKMNEADEDGLASHWETSLEHYTVPTVEKKSLPAWAWALIGVGIGLVVIGIGVGVFFIVRKRKKDAAPKETLKKVYTVDESETEEEYDYGETYETDEEEK